MDGAGRFGRRAVQNARRRPKSTAQRSRRAVAPLLLALLLAGPAYAQQVTFACDPRDARVFLEVGGTGPALLGPCNQPVDTAAFAGRNTVNLTFKRPGWLDETRTVPADWFHGRDRYPDASQGPVRLSPAPDGLGQRLPYYLKTYWLALLGLGLVVAGAVLQMRRRTVVVLAPQQVTGGDPFLGKELGGYTLSARLGVGGMGTVYRGEREGQSAAVKVMHPQFAADPVNRKRFRREVEIYRELKHRNILRLDDCGDQDGVLFLVFELLEGQTLRDLLRGRKLSVAEALEFALPLAETVDYAHSRSIVHRDLKPENLFLTEDGRLVVMDFGLARGGEFTQHTATGVGLGTPAYMAPEQVQGRPEEASDRYSFGILLFEMFAGTVPFHGDDPMAVAFAQVGQQPPSLHQLRPDLPPHVSDVVARLLAKDPRKRHPSLKEAVQEL